MSESKPVSPYGSAKDIPSVQRMEQEIAGLKWFKVLLGSSCRRRLEELEQEHGRLVELVDKFYSLLGERNWVYTDDLKVSSMEIVINTPDPAVAEERLVSYYKERGRVRKSVVLLEKFDDMRPRLGLLKKAIDDYEQGRYYSVVFVLLSVMDGFINDLDRASRQGLHTRQAEDMVAWDSAAGHHLGLGNAHKSFAKGFYRTSEERVVNLYRNGIMHGILVNFDNEIVATKAWNRLFAVADWAESVKKRSKPIMKLPSLREAIATMGEVRKQRKSISKWRPYECDSSAAESCDVFGVCKEFLELWKYRRWAPLSKYFLHIVPPAESMGKRAVHAKDLYMGKVLESWSFSRVRHTAAAVAKVRVELLINENECVADLRWVRVSSDNRVACEWQPGEWKIAPYWPDSFLECREVGNL